MERAGLAFVGESCERGSRSGSEKNQRGNVRFRLYPLAENQTLENGMFCAASYPLTLILEKESTARLGVGRPIDSAGRNVVKISICFTCGSTSLESEESDRIR